MFLHLDATGVGVDVSDKARCQEDAHTRAWWIAELSHVPRLPCLRRIFGRGIPEARAGRRFHGLVGFQHGLKKPAHTLPWVGNPVTTDPRSQNTSLKFDSVKLHQAGRCHPFSAGPGEIFVHIWPTDIIYMCTHSESLADLMLSYSWGGHGFPAGSEPR